MTDVRPAVSFNGETKKKRILVHQPNFDIHAAFPISFKPLAAPRKQFQNRIFLRPASKKEKNLLFTEERSRFRIKGSGGNCESHLAPKNLLPPIGFHSKTKVIFTPNENNFQFLSNSRQTFLPRQTQNYLELCISKSGKSCKPLLTVNCDHTRPEKYFLKGADINSFANSDDSTVENYYYISHSEDFLKAMAPDNTERTRLSVRSEVGKTTAMNSNRAKNSITSASIFNRLSDSEHSLSYPSPTRTVSVCSVESGAVGRTDDKFTIPRQSWSQNRKKVLAPIPGKQNHGDIKSRGLETKIRLHEIAQNIALKTFRASMLPSVRGKFNRLERTKEDLIRRNAFLQKQIDKEKEDLSSVAQRKKLSEVTEENQKLKIVNENLNENIQEINYKTSVSGRLLNSAAIELNERQNEKKKLLSQLGQLQNQIERKNVEGNSLTNENSSLVNREVIIKEKIQQLMRKVEKKNKTRKEKEDEKSLVLEEIAKMEETVIAEELNRREQSLETKSLTESLSTTRKNQEVLETRNIDTQRQIEDLTFQIEEKRKNLEKLKNLHEETMAQLAKSQRDFRRKEEVKMSMRSVPTQTTGCFVIMRDIAWIRVVEEEVILSPHCVADSDLDETASTGFPVGAVTPVFEVYNLVTNEANKSSSPSKTNNSLRNKRLVDAYKGTEYMWIGENGE